MSGKLREYVAQVITKGLENHPEYEAEALESYYESVKTFQAEPNVRQLFEHAKKYEPERAFECLSHYSNVWKTALKDPLMSKPAKVIVHTFNTSYVKKRVDLKDLLQLKPN